VTSSDQEAVYVPKAPPAARLIREGPASLGDEDLLCLVMSGGAGQGESIRRAVRTVLQMSRSPSGLPRLCWHALSAAGVSEHRSARILAAVELALRMARDEIPERDPMQHPAAIARYLHLKFGSPHQEVMGAVYLDSRKRLIAVEDFFRGTINRTATEPRVVLRLGLNLGATGVVLFHTHPSGDPAPSAEDLAFTRRFEEAAEVIGIRLVDHLIVGTATRWISLRERGWR
jgi:DNA repair protein RadC